MNNFKECKRIIIGKKERILYKLPNSNKLYIKYNGKMVGYTEYKKNMKNKKQKGGYRYQETDKNNIIEINGIKYIKDLDYPTQQIPYEDPINGLELKQEDAILFDEKFYDINSLYSWINYTSSYGNNNKIVPHTRRPFTNNEIININNFYKNRNSVMIKQNEYNKSFYLQLKNGKYLKIISIKLVNQIYTSVSRIEDATIFVASNSFIENYTKEYKEYIPEKDKKNIYRIYIKDNIKGLEHLIYRGNRFRSIDFLLDDNNKYFIPLANGALYDEALKIIEI